jgi:peroxiredoxin/tetratricopeptide (TPR) repeat protein
MYGYYFALNLAFQVDRAREVADRFVSRYPSSDRMPLMAYRYIQSNTQPGTLDNAEALQDYISEYPGSPLLASASASLARFYAPTDWAKARKYYELAMRADSSHPYQHNQFAYECAVRGVDLADAESAILKALDMSSHNYYRRRLPHLSFEQRKESMEKDRAAFYDTYGWIKFRLGEYDDALVFIKKAVDLVGEENAGAEILGHLAETYERLGQSDKALDAYLKLLQVDPRNDEMKKNALRIFISQGGTEEKFDSLVTAATPVPKERGTPAPDFTVKTLEDRKVQLSNFRDEAVVVVNFWATWCGPCRKEIPVLNTLVDRFRDNTKVVFLAISSEEKNRLETFTKANEFEYVVCYEGKDASRAYGVVYIPTHVIIDLQGNIYSKHVGFREGIDEALESDIRAALGDR